MKLTRATPYLSLLVAGLIAGCGQESGQPEPADAMSEEPKAAAPSASATGSEVPASTRSAAPDGARVFFVTPEDGATVSNPVKVEFAIEGMELVPAGQARPSSGHHHVLIDTDLPVMSLPVPADANHVHFGDASSSTELTLAPGEHTLRLLFADHLHIPHEPPVYSDPITITVE
jgi:hypothetical protein